MARQTWASPCGYNVEYDSAHYALVWLPNYGKGTAGRVKIQKKED